MPLHQLAVAPADVDGAKLALALNAPAPPPLASCRLEHPDGGGLVLGVLGASHVVIVERAEVSSPNRFRAPRAMTAVICPNAPMRPATTSNRAPRRTTRRRSAGSRADCATTARTKAGWLGGVFPGDDAALTALAAEPDGPGWRWQTWHLYPGHPAGSGGTVVHTTSRWHP